MRLKDNKPVAFKEAHSYMANAKDFLRKAGRDNGMNRDRKYVKMASHAAWSGVLEAVDRYLESKGVQRPQGRPDKKWYADQLSRLSRKLNSAFVGAYDVLHLSLGYDGALPVKIAEAGLEQGYKVIELCQKG